MMHCYNEILIGTNALLKGVILNAWLTEKHLSATAELLLLFCIEKNIQLESVLTNVVHLYKFICLQTLVNFFCLEGGNPGSYLL